ncbi:Hypothetical protein CINCED_3A025140 [Cinara cedri]|uniref:Uncharacterized protein n=1 Tax=Cinara cedri TaxID=506608 RepID=A0A5E4MUR2_9HEMI|nr:Hypothetical protein CINCED_3A025140 [Cinara cedri]
MMKNRRVPSTIVRKAGPSEYRYRWTIECLICCEGEKSKAGDSERYRIYRNRIVFLPHNRMALCDTKYLDNIYNYKICLQTLKPALIDRLKSIVVIDPIKFNLKLVATYHKPQVDNSAENRAFEISARPLFSDSEIENIVEEKFAKLLKEEELYQGRDSGFSLQTIDGLLLGVYKLTSTN